jgi:hypothetical protein
MSKNKTKNTTTESATRDKINDYYTVASRSNGDAAAGAASICRRPLGAHAPWQVTL